MNATTWPRGGQDVKATQHLDADAHLQAAQEERYRQCQANADGDLGDHYPLKEQIRIKRKTQETRTAQDYKTNNERETDTNKAGDKNSDHRDWHEAQRRCAAPRQ